MSLRAPALMHSTFLVLFLPPRANDLGDRRSIISLREKPILEESDIFFFYDYALRFRDVYISRNYDNIDLCNAVAFYY